MTHAERLPRWNFETALLLSLFFHLALWLGFSWSGRGLDPSDTSSVELDLTRPFVMTSDPRLARRSPNPGTGAPRVERPQSVPITPPAETKPQAKPQEWVLPGENTKILEKPTEETVPQTPTGLGGLGTGDGDGEVDWVYLTNLPKILNMDDLIRYLRQFYPEAERRAGKEGYVVLDLHIDNAGRVKAVDVVQSAGEAFDEAAKKVVAEVRFSPAMVKDKPVAVKIRQTIGFRLED